eukprot:3307150-Ditylum_brightwellii.AAC.4
MACVGGYSVTAYVGNLIGEPMILSPDLTSPFARRARALGATIFTATFSQFADEPVDVQQVDNEVVVINETDAFGTTWVVM